MSKKFDGGHLYSLPSVEWLFNQNEFIISISTRKRCASLVFNTPSNILFLSLIFGKNFCYQV